MKELALKLKNIFKSERQFIIVANKFINALIVELATIKAEITSVEYYYKTQYVSGTFVHNGTTYGFCIGGFKGSVKSLTYWLTEQFCEPEMQWVQATDGLAKRLNLREADPEFKRFMSILSGRRGNQGKAKIIPLSSKLDGSSFGIRSFSNKKKRNSFVKKLK